MGVTMSKEEGVVAWAKGTLMGHAMTVSDVVSIRQTSRGVIHSSRT